MTEVERQLRDMLSRYAYDAPAGHLMLSRVRQAAVRRRRRRRAVATGGAALALVLAASGAATLAARPAPIQPKLSMGLGQDVAGVNFAAGSPVDLTFPFTPPAAPVPGTRPMLTLVAGRPTLQYLPAEAEDTQSRTNPPVLPTGTRLPMVGSDAAGAAVLPSDGPSASPQAGQFTTGQPGTNSATTDSATADPATTDSATTDPVTVVVSGSPWDDGPFTAAIKVRSTTVHGIVGVIGERPSPAGPPDYVLTWTERGGPWVGVSAPETISTVDLTDFASALSPQPVTQPGPFDFDLVPADFAVDNISPSTVTFRPPGVAASSDFVDKLVVSMDAEPARMQGDRPVKVGARAGWLHVVDNVVMLRIDEGDGRSLTVQAPERLRIDQPDLLRFAAGVHITAAAVPARG
ncbi:hypothetical protein [Rugosimonospora africana]|uniref:Uncharacterized protein n=1 Tax=Rugosimonospora africana TaxID=556532 RepID=A0A8J3VQA9_9ACTN|nr:hypothetical protein [Rugosimonospora africana]GIH14847.1 hypothetical protein Raf01_30190 [Rugosimonospora africana]